MMSFGKLVTLACCVPCLACAGEADRSDARAASDTATAAADEGARSDTARTQPTSASGPTLRADGIGDIDVGITVVDAIDRAGTAAVDPDAGAECRYITFPTLPEGVSLMVIGDTIRRIDVDSPGVLTERGAGIGMTTARIDGIYGSALQRMPHKYEPDGEYLMVIGANPDTRIVFETATDTVRTMHAGSMPEVMWVERCG